MPAVELTFPRKQQGMALLVVWILVMALVVTMGTVFYRHQLSIARVTSHIWNEQALLLALSVENWATGMLGPRYDDLSADHLLENWAQAVPALPVEGGFISGCMIDMQGRFNLNALSAYTPERYDAEFTAEETAPDQASTFIDLLGVLGLPASEVSAGILADWTDADSQSFSPQASGEQLAYDAGRVRVMVPNSPMVETTELFMLQGFDALSVQSLLPFVSALPVETPVNINTAPETVLLALAGERGQTFADYVLQARPFTSLQAFQQGVAQSFALEPAEVAARWNQRRVAVASDYFSIILQVSLGSIQLEVTSLLDRSGGDVPVVIRRTVTRVPAIDRSALEEEELALLADPCTGVIERDDES